MPKKKTAKVFSVPKGKTRRIDFLKKRRFFEGAIRLSWFLVIVALLVLFFIFGVAWQSVIAPDHSLMRSIKKNSTGDNHQGVSLSWEKFFEKESVLQKIKTKEELGEILSAVSSPEKQLMKAMDGVSRSFGAPETVEQKGETAKSYSTTNIQVEGVDEADIVKTDGKYTYALTGKSLYLIDAYPPQGAQILSKIKFDDYPNGLYLDKNYLVVYGSKPSFSLQKILPDFPFYSSFAFLKVFDIKDRVHPRLVKDLTFEGSVLGSRLVGNYLYFLTSKRQYGFSSRYPWPVLLENNALQKEKFPEIYYAPVPEASYSFVRLSVLRVDNPQAKMQSRLYLLPADNKMYVSLDNIYLTYHKYLSEDTIRVFFLKDLLWERLSAQEKNLLTEIENISSQILSPTEKQAKTKRILSAYLASLPASEQEKIEGSLEKKIKEKYKNLAYALEKTVIHKININQDKISYQGFAEVPGHVLNQFSMDEYKGFFRVATTLSPRYFLTGKKQTDYQNNLYVLNKDLKIVGSLEGLEKKERIYSARFIGDRVYLVTFQRTDPLLAIDLSNPHKPQVLGELRIPGFSNYLHPYGQDFLIGLGKETTEGKGDWAITQGLKLSLFDVSDIHNPKEIDKVVLGEKGSNSLALFEHKAFLLAPEKELLAFPVDLIKGEGQEQETDNLGGLAVFKISEKGFQLRGYILHKRDLAEEEKEILPKEERIDFYPYYSSQDYLILRSFYINDVLYTLSSRYLGLNNLEDLSEIKKLDFYKFKPTDFQIIN